MKLKTILISAIGLILHSTVSFSSDAAPPCLAKGAPIAVDDAQVLNWEKTTENQFTARAHVQGKIETLYEDRNGHNHFAIQIGNTNTELLEVVYNNSFGALPQLEVGMEVEACGDFITSTAQSGPYPPSPAGAIIHWIHKNPKGHGHDSGFLMINGVLYGQGNGSGNIE